MTPDKKWKRLKDIIQSRSHWAVAYSGGLDSSFLLWFIVTQTKSHATAFFVNHDLLPAEVFKSAENFISYLKNHYCRELPILKVIDLNLLSNKEIKRNSKKRCYYCKYLMFSSILDEIVGLECDALCDGTLASDSLDERPGFVALKELGVISPLKTAGFTKHEVREVAKREITWTDDLWFRFESCLATRIPYDYELNADLIKRIDMLEQFVKKRVPGPVRARFNGYGKSIRLEIEIDYLGIFTEYINVNELVCFAEKLGFERLCLDLGGFRME